MRSSWQRAMTVLAVCCAFGLAACGGGNDGGDGGPIVEEDSGTTDTDAGVQPDAIDDDATSGCQSSDDCSGNLVCEDNQCVEPSCQFTECSDNSDCQDPEPMCNTESSRCVECMNDSDCSTDGYTCSDNNSCVVENPQCESVGESCDPSAPAGNGFACADLGTGAKCVNLCDPRNSSPCESGSSCLPLVASDRLPYACYPTQCGGPDDLDGCDNISNHAFFSESSDFKCSSVSNDADVCLPSGTKSTGESCTAVSPVEGVFCRGDDCEACTAGNVCQGNVCRSVCKADASSGDFSCSGNECVGSEDDDVVGTDVGFCGEQCEAYSRGQCSSDGEGCMPLNNEVGFCKATGDKGFMEDCAENTECGEGMRCVTFQEGSLTNSAVRKCLPVCNAPAVDDDNRRDNDATCGGKMYGRFAYLGGDPSEIDAYIGGSRTVDNLSVGAISDADDQADGSQYFGFRPQELQIDVTEGSASDASNPIASTAPFVESGQVHTWAVVPTGSGVEITAVDVPVGIGAPASGMAKVRLVHQVPDFGVDVDVVAVPQDGNLGSDGIELATGAAKGDAGMFSEVSGGTYDVYVFETGAAREAGEALAEVSNVTVAADSMASLYLAGTAATGDSADVTATSIPYIPAPKAPDYTCTNQSGQADPPPAAGLCFNECEISDYDGTSSGCYAEGNGCMPYSSDTHLCFPMGEKQPGEECDPDAFNPCAEGARCREYGDGSGRCHSLCRGGGSDNATLSCDSSQSCSATQDGSFGQCQDACSPNDEFVGADCPQGLESCFPQSGSAEMPEGAYCSGSHNKAAGQPCGGDSSRDSLLQNCQPGLICAYDDAKGTNGLAGLFQPQSGQKPTCKEPCDPFAESSGCSDGKSCIPNIGISGSAVAGFCVETGQCIEDKSTSSRCYAENVGTACGQNSMCAMNDETPLCIEYCDAETGEGCTGSDMTCEEYIGGIGQCIPEQ